MSILQHGSCVALQVASDVVKEFSDDNVKYLELRTTPRANLDAGNTTQAHSYLFAVHMCWQISRASLIVSMC